MSQDVNHLEQVIDRLETRIEARLTRFETLLNTQVVAVAVLRTKAAIIGGLAATAVSVIVWAITHLTKDGVG